MTNVDRVKFADSQLFRILKRPIEQSRDADSNNASLFSIRALQHTQIRHYIFFTEISPLDKVFTAFHVLRKVSKEKEDTSKGRCQ